MNEKTKREIQDEELRKIIREELLADTGLMALIKDEAARIKNNGFHEKDKWGDTKGGAIVEEVWSDLIISEVRKVMEESEDFLVKLIHEAMPSRESLLLKAKDYAAKSAEDIIMNQFKWKYSGISWGR